MKTAAVAFVRFAALAASVCAASGVARAQDPYQSSTDFARYAEQLRDSAVLHMQPQVVIPGSSSLGVSTLAPGRPYNPAVPYQWKTDIVTTIFWVGESASARNPVANVSSSWDLGWQQSFGGFDDPDPAHRRNFVAAGFTPRQNPFYCALPYNDVTKGSTKPESRLVIPWYASAFVQEGHSVCKDRWLAIRNPRTQKTCYAQWSDCGPFRTDHWQYVFGPERPRPNLNQAAGLDVSPAVRDYLGLGGTDVTDWKFVEFRDIPRGPWSQYGDNNTFVQTARGAADPVAMATASAPIAVVREPVAPAPPPTTATAAVGGPQVSVH